MVDGLVESTWENKAVLATGFIGFRIAKEDDGIVLLRRPPVDRALRVHAFIASTYGTEGIKMDHFLRHGKQSADIAKWFSFKIHV